MIKKKVTREKYMLEHGCMGIDEKGKYNCCECDSSTMNEEVIVGYEK